jgi:hypothetical protein
MRALHEPYSMVICRCDAPLFGIEHRRLGVTGSSKPSVIRHLSNMRRDFLSPPTAIGLAAAPQVSGLSLFISVFFNSKGAWHIDCAYSVFNKDERR